MSGEKLVHICLAGPFSEGFSYQENLLSKYHRRLGYEVTIIAPSWSWTESGNIEHVGEMDYRNSDDVRVIRIDNNQGKSVSYRFKTYRKLRELLEALSPDIVFLHGCQLRDSKTIALYLKNHSACRLYVDNHGSYDNSGRGFLSKHVLHRIIWKHYAGLLIPYTIRFWGVTRSCCDFLHENYRIPCELIDCLPLGVDDEALQKDRSSVRESVKKRWHINAEDFLLVTGGKIDLDKNVHSLVAAFEKVKDRDVKLLVFGSISEDAQRIIDQHKTNCVVFTGWASAQEAIDYMTAADLVIFPGSESAFWNQSVACGVPGIYKRWEGGNPVDLGGNCMFLESGTEDEIFRTLVRLLNNRSTIKNMGSVAQERGIEAFAYSRLAAKSISPERGE